MDIKTLFDYVLEIIKIVLLEKMINVTILFVMNFQV